MELDVLLKIIMKNKTFKYIENGLLALTFGFLIACLWVDEAYHPLFLKITLSLTVGYLGFKITTH